MVYVLKIPEKDIVFTYKAMSESNIRRELAKFCGDEDTKPTTRYLVRTTSTFSTGLTLNITIRLGLLEPDFRISAMIQMYRRYYR
jgi:hypothetical protein